MLWPTLILQQTLSWTQSVLKIILLCVVLVVTTIDAIIHPKYVLLWNNTVKKDRLTSSIKIAVHTWRPLEELVWPFIWSLFNDGQKGLTPLYTSRKETSVSSAISDEIFLKIFGWNNIHQKSMLSRIISRMRYASSVYTNTIIQRLEVNWLLTWRIFREETFNNTLLRLRYLERKDHRIFL